VGKAALDLTTDIQPISEFRSNASALLEQVRTTGRPLVLTRRGRGAAVVLDIGAYQGLIDELAELRDVHRGLADVEAGRLLDHEEVARRTLERLKG
jgi:antitoxin YefM